LKKENVYHIQFLKDCVVTYRLITNRNVTLGFATNVINSTLSVLTPGIRILYFCVFVENDSKKSQNVQSLM